MRKTRPEDFDPMFVNKNKPEDVDLADIVPLKAKSPIEISIKRSPQPTNSHDVKEEESTHVGTVIPRHHDTNHDTTTPRYRDTLTRNIRHAVKSFGKEAATHRFTLEEKKKLAEIEFTYKMAGIKTSENEITRIAINFVIADYQENGENSVLEQVLRALNE